MGEKKEKNGENKDEDKKEEEDDDDIETTNEIDDDYTKYDSNTYYSVAHNINETITESAPKRRDLEKWLQDHPNYQETKLNEEQPMDVDESSNMSAKKEEQKEKNGENKDEDKKEEEEG